MRIQPKPATNATKKQNNGSRPASTTWASNQPDTAPPSLAEHQRFRSASQDGATAAIKSASQDATRLVVP